MPGARSRAARGPRRHPRGRRAAAALMERFYLSLGSNVGDRLAMLRDAVRRLSDCAEIAFVAASRLYETEPWEREPGRTAGEADRHLNCVVTIETSLEPRALLERVHAIEEALGRARPGGTPEARRFVQIGREHV